MHRLEESIEIAAPAARVWGILTEFKSYSEWNPFVRHMDCDGNVGSEIHVTMAQPGSKPVSFKPTLTKFDKGRKMEWAGQLPVPGLFNGRHSYVIDPVDDQHVIFRQSEDFSGILTPFFKLMLETQTRQAFALMNKALKERAEQQPQPSITR